MKLYKLTQDDGEEIQALLDRIENLTTATPEVDGLMSKRDKQILDDVADDRPMTNIEIQEILNT